MPSPKYILHYFPVYARGESIRQLLVLAGQEFEDRIISFEEWPKIKTKFPFHQIPVLEENGKYLSQEFAINRYLARKYGLAGKTDWEQAQVDALADQWKDFHNEVIQYFRVAIRKFKIDVGDEDKLRVEVFEPGVQKHLPFFENAVKGSGSGFLVGSNVTWVDTMVAEWFNTYAQKHPELLKQFPALAAHREQVHSIPRIKQHREKRFFNLF